MSMFLKGAAGRAPQKPAVDPATQPWVEKYRPQTIDDVSAQEHAVAVLRKTLTSTNLPHMLFYGPPGTGKTSTILALSRQLFGPDHFRNRVLELNASDERGISIVREKIKNFARQTPRAADVNSQYPCPPYKIIILDEADSMTQDAQGALRRIMETYARVTRFCLVCNYVTRIIEPLASRCSKFRFHPLDSGSTRARLEHIVSTEKVNIDSDAVTALITTSEGDLRRSITYLQSAARLSASQDPPGTIHASDIQEIAGVVPDNVINRFAAAIGVEVPNEGMDVDGVKDFDGIRSEVRRIMQQGYSTAQLLSQLHDIIILHNTITSKQKTACALAFATADKALTDGADEELQLLEIGVGSLPPVLSIMFVQASRTAARVSRIQQRSLASTVLFAKTPEQWQEQTVAQLRSEAKSRGLATGGSKSKLIERIVAHSKPNEQPRPPAGISIPSPSGSARHRWISSNVKIPETPEAVDEGPVIPFLAQKFDSPPSESASPPQEVPDSVPRVVTVASAATHIGGGPQHAIHDAVDAHAIETPDSDGKSGGSSFNLKGFLTELGIPVSFNIGQPGEAIRDAVASTGVSAPKVEKDTTNLKDAQRELNEEEQRGLYVLGGIVVGGLILGSFGNKKSTVKKEKH
ncbi:AAA family ATPase [Ceratobasidium sp. AG-Ba]|nr:AAA family ATPase [Ceratobasidium sp. AG-Ba]